ncbi:hypothetical protein [Victivallis vadensis]|uniref:hypothetical protein n=1 Tax=Victivallis vadensis TaxID=172901 RepID=UPI003AF8E7BB
MADDGKGPEDHRKSRKKKKEKETAVPIADFQGTWSLCVSFGRLAEISDVAIAATVIHSRAPVSFTILPVVENFPLLIILSARIFYKVQKNKQPHFISESDPFHICSVRNRNGRQRIIFLKSRCVQVF